MIHDRTVRLREGVYLHHIQTQDYKNAAFSIRLCFRQKRGMSALYAVLPHVMCSENYPDETAMQLRAEELYGTQLAMSSDAIGKMRQLTFSARMIDVRYVPEDSGMLPDAINLLFDIVFHPFRDRETGYFSEERVRHEREGHLDHIRSIRNYKSTYAVALCCEQMRSSRYYDVAVYGTEEETEKITPALLWREYRSILRHAEIHLSYIGSASYEEIFSIADRELAGCCLGRTPSEHHSFAFGRRRAARIHRVTVPSDGNQTILVLGYRTGILQDEKDAWKYAMLTEILSDSPLAKLFTEVREREGLCYSVHAGSNLAKGIMLISAGIDSARAKDAERAIRREIRRTARAEITDEEMAAARESLISSYQAILDNALEYEAYYAMMAIRRRSASIKEQMDRLLSVTKADVARLASMLTLNTVLLLTPGEVQDHA